MIYGVAMNSVSGKERVGRERKRTVEALFFCLLRVLSVLRWQLRAGGSAPVTLFWFSGCPVLIAQF
ncbi:hypothetical protein [Paenibacillus physcomitrellae]|uniref:Uncharacterized protein n=1 Tax=Paenibacillus physcomitrellae TaxID=1619311 RepID=A0ABQ1GMV9_9BACL|nr:hypothetical protein [Paenibacillus physcomitrellae]GGA46929.1 hypothetical protein GCM10010917_35230 [Paenibacillus physcomitrellae]